MPDNHNEPCPSLNSVDKIDIFASLRQAKQGTRELASTTTTIAQELSDNDTVESLSDSILALLSPKHAHTGGSATQDGDKAANERVNNMLTSMREHDETELKEGAARELDEPGLSYLLQVGGDDLASDMMSLINEHNKSCEEAKRRRSNPESNWLLDEEAIRERLELHLADPGHKRYTQRQKLEQSLAEAQRHDDRELVDRRRAELKILESRIFREFAYEAMRPLRELMGDATEPVLRELRNLNHIYQGNLALAYAKHIGPSALEVVQSADSLHNQVRTQADDTLNAVTTGHIDAVSHLLDQANNSTRRSTTRFKLLSGADFRNEDEREQIAAKRLGDPKAAEFIARSFHELSDTKKMVEMAELGLEKAEMELKELEGQLKEAQDGAEVALLAHLASSPAQKTGKEHI